MSKSEIRNKFEYQMTKCPKLRRWKYGVLIIGTFLFWSLFRIDPPQADTSFRASARPGATLLKKSGGAVIFQKKCT